MKYIGAHVSIAGGVENAPLNAKAIGATAFAMFVKNQRQWSAPPIPAGSIAAFQKNCADCGFSPDHVLPHDGYLINLGQPDPVKRENALRAFIDEMTRVSQLGLKLLNFHPGSHLKMIPLDEELTLIADSVRQALDTVPGVTAVFENTAGQGTNVGFTFEQLAAMLERTDRPGRVGVCLDTCHLFAAGYDLTGDDAYAHTMSEFDRLIGFEYLRGMHLNDSKSTLGQKLDRHNSLGEGFLGWETFRRLMRDPRLDDIPLVLETIDEARWPQEIAALREMAR